MKIKKTYNLSLSQNSSNFNSSIFSNYKQLSLFPTNSLHCRKPQIVSIPGVSIKVQNCCRVMAGDEILDDFLSLDEAVRLAKRGAA